MPITERTLKRWRKDALRDREIHLTEIDPHVNVDYLCLRVEELCNRILRMTQELLDQHLLREQKSTQTRRGE